MSLFILDIGVGFCKHIVIMTSKQASLSYFQSLFEFVYEVYFNVPKQTLVESDNIWIAGTMSENMSTTQMVEMASNRIVTDVTQERMGYALFTC